MTNIEIVLLIYNIFLQIAFFALLALQRSMNKTMAGVLKVLMEQTP